MGFFTKTDPLERTRQALVQQPTNPKLLMELAALLRQRGQVGPAVDHYLQAAQAEWDLGLTHKASAIARLAVQLAPGRADAHEMLVRCFEASDFREDLRSQLRALLEVHRGAGHHAEAVRVEQRLAALGPPR